MRLYREIHPQFSDMPQEKINEAVVKLLFRIMFIRFAEDTPLLPSEFLARSWNNLKGTRNGAAQAGFTSTCNGISPGWTVAILIHLAYIRTTTHCSHLYRLDAPHLSIQDDLLKDIVKKLSHYASDERSITRRSTLRILATSTKSSSAT